MGNIYALVWGTKIEVVIAVEIRIAITKANRITMNLLIGIHSL